jgi:hypothetical protein
VIPATLIPAITASLPLIEAAFKWVWSHLETPAEDLAWESIAAVLPAGTGAHVEPLFRAVWRQYEDGELARAWADLSRKLAAGDEVTRAHIETIDDVTEGRLDAWDAKDGFKESKAVPDVG